MLHSSSLIRTVLSTLREYPDVRKIVLDPVMVATSGDPLLQPEAITTLRDELMPYSKVITPNLPEASLLLGETVDHQDQFEDAARALSRLTDAKVSVMLKAGHLENNTLTDIFYNAETGTFLRLATPRVNTVNTHGTGCTLSSAIAAYLAKVQTSTAPPAWPKTTSPTQSPQAHPTPSATAMARFIISMPYGVEAVTPKNPPTHKHIAHENPTSPPLPCESHRKSRHDGNRR